MLRVGVGTAITNTRNPIDAGEGVAPVITGSPTISGTEQVGETLTATPASVTGTPTPTRTWQWERSGSAISGATSSTYMLVAADEGETLTVGQTETNASGSDTAESAATGVIAAAGGFDPATLFALELDGDNLILTPATLVLSDDTLTLETL